jgi:hypothetical protein
LKSLILSIGNDFCVWRWAHNSGRISAPNTPTNQLISLMRRFLLRPSADAWSAFLYDIDRLPTRSEVLDPSDQALIKPN